MRLQHVAVLELRVRTISSIFQIAPHGTSAAVSRASQVLRSSLASAPSMISRSAGSLAMRAGQSLKRGSASASARPIAFIRRCELLLGEDGQHDVAALAALNRSAVGLRLTEPLPIWPLLDARHGVLGDTGPARKASAASSIATSTSWPRPVCVRW